MHLYRLVSVQALSGNIKYVLLWFLMLVAFNGKAQSARPMVTKKVKPELDAVVKLVAAAFLADTARVGLSIGVITNGQTYTYHYGSTQKGRTIRPTNATIYEIGSISKTFTGLLLAQALADQKLKLTDDIRRHLGGNYLNLEYNQQPIQIRHLVNHTSGLPPFLPERPEIFKAPLDSIPVWLNKVLKSYTKDQFLKDLHAVKIDTIPGYKYKYSNTGAQLLSFILEKAYGTSYANLVEKYITQPWAMDQTRVFKQNSSVNLAKGYSPTGKLMPYLPPILAPAGGLYSSLPDMLRYMSYQLNEKDKLVYASHQPTWGDPDTYALGYYWKLDKTKTGARRVWHTGGTFGFASCCILYPETGTGIILLTNQFEQSVQNELQDMAERIATSIFKKPAHNPNFQKTSK